MARAPPNSRETQLARFVLSKILKVRAGENVVVEGWTHTLPWATAIAREARRMKAFPIVLHEDEASFWDSVDANEDSTLGAAPTHEWAMLGKTDVYIHMWGAGDRIRLEHAARQAGGKDPRIQHEVVRRRHEGGAPRDPTRGRATVPEPRRSLRRGRAEVDGHPRGRHDGRPRAAPRRGRPDHEGAGTRPNGPDRDDHGTDLTLGLKHRKASIQTGEVTEKDKTGPFGMLSLVPTGVVQVALDENVADGTFIANRTSYFETGRATGGVFEFKDGKLVGHHYDQGSEFFDDDYKKAGKDETSRAGSRSGSTPSSTTRRSSRTGKRARS